MALPRQGWVFIRCVDPIGVEVRGQQELTHARANRPTTLVESKEKGPDPKTKAPTHALVLGADVCVTS
jgi:hypothetical protein